MADQDQGHTGSPARLDVQIHCRDHAKNQTPPFEGLGYKWQLLAVRNEVTSMLSILIEAHTEDFFQRRDDIAFTLVAVSHQDSTQTHLKRVHRCCFLANARHCGFHEFMRLSMLDDGTWLSNDGELHLLLVMDLLDNQDDKEKAFWTSPPTQSLTGDTDLVLDDGTTLSAHSVHLQQASTVFSTALSCASSADQQIDCREDEPASKKQKAPLRLPLPGTSRKQALLLLHTLYAWMRESFAAALEPPELIALARCAHKFGVSKVLELVDSSLVKVCTYTDVSCMNECPGCGTSCMPAASGWVNPKDAAAQLQVAQQLHLRSFENHVATYIGMHPHEVDTTGLSATNIAILAGACKLRARFVSKFTSLGGCAADDLDRYVAL